MFIVRVKNQLNVILECCSQSLRHALSAVGLMFIVRVKNQLNVILECCSQSLRQTDRQTHL